MILVGDCRARLRELETESVDAIVTDPPYELGFMGKSWDASGIAYDLDVWRECLRVLKPGGHLLAFSGSRTYHRMVVAIEDAGFEIRDQIMWLYGSGFPKSHDVSKAIDREAGAVREVIGYRPGVVAGNGGRYNWHNGSHEGRTMAVDTAAATPEAARWQGWGTALKPAHEPICVARKPLRGTVAQNVLAYGTGAINVDGCRVRAEPGDEPLRWSHGRGMGFHGAEDRGPCEAMTSSGRWPANVIHDGSEEVVGMFPVTTSSQPSANGQYGNGKGKGANGVSVFGSGFNSSTPNRAPIGDSGSAARFFYSAKASKADRDEGMEAWEEATPGQRTGGRAEGSAGINAYAGTRGPARNVHPTVKPTDLMRYLVRLVTPPGGLVLDPFTGSGSTGKGAVLEGFRFIGIELSPEYAAIARARIRHAVGHVAPEPVTEAQVPDALPGQLRLFA